MGIYLRKVQEGTRRAAALFAGCRLQIALRTAL